MRRNGTQIFDAWGSHGSEQKDIVFWDLTLCNLVRKYQRFEKTIAFKSCAKCVGRRFLRNVYTIRPNHKLSHPVPPPPQKKTVILGRQKAGTSGCDILNVTQEIKIRLYYQSLLFTNWCKTELLQKNIKIYIQTAPTCFGAVTTVRERIIWAC